MGERRTEGGTLARWVTKRGKDAGLVCLMILSGQINGRLKKSYSRNCESSIVSHRRKHLHTAGSR